MKMIFNLTSALLWWAGYTFAAKSDDSCQVYLSDEDSLYMGRSGAKAGDQLGTAVEPVGMKIANYNRDNIPWLYYAYKPDAVGLDDDLYDGALLPGLGMYMQCQNRHIEATPNVKLVQDADGRFFFQATKKIEPGVLLVVEACSVFDREAKSAVRQRDVAALLDLDEVLSNRDEMICMDGFRPNAPTEGAVADQVLTVTPVLHLHRFDVAVLEQLKPATSNSPIPLPDHGIIYNQTNIVANQTILDSCLGHPDSNLLFWPTSSPDWTAAIPHNAETPNVALRWSTAIYGDTTSERQDLSVVRLLESYETVLAMELVALRDLKPDEPLSMDYGQAWEKAKAAHPTTPYPAVVPHLYSANWMRQDPKPNGDFIAHKLPPNVLSPVRWAETAEVASAWGFRLGLDPLLTETLMEYAKRLGVIDMMEFVTLQGNALPPSTDLLVHDGQWYLQRPAKVRRTNMHWLSPTNQTGQEDLLQALQHGGFDDVLSAVGEYLNMDGLVVYHLSFMAASWTAQGWLHYDVTGTQGKVFNIIIPLLSAKETGPELDIQDYETGDVGRYRYEPNVAIMQGDDATHATSAIDYMNEFRLALSVYVADMNEDNVESIADAVTQLYPPRDPDLFLSWAGMHWDPNDPAKKLPPPGPDHILLRECSSIAAGIDGSPTCDTTSTSTQ